MYKEHDQGNILTKQGYKNTKSRKAIVEILEGTNAPITADELYFNIREKGISTNLSTVYRTLELMESKGLVIKTIITDGKARYELLKAEHRHHLICLNCNKIVPLDDCPLAKLESDVEKKTEFDITGHKLELYGLCPKCKKS